MERDFVGYVTDAAKIGGPNLAGQAKPETVTHRLRCALERARMLESLSDKLAFRVAGPRPGPIAQGTVGVPPEEPDVLLRLAEDLDAALRQIGHNIEYANDRV